MPIYIIYIGMFVMPAIAVMPTFNNNQMLPRSPKQSVICHEVYQSSAYQCFL